MKKTLTSIIVLAMCLTLCACGEKTKTDENIPQAAVVESAEWEVSFILTNSGCKAINTQITTITETDTNEFVFYGTYSAKNVYNAPVRGTFNGTGRYNPDTENASVDVDIK